MRTSRRASRWMISATCETASPRDDDETEPAGGDCGASELLPDEDPLLAVGRELAKGRRAGLRKRHVDELVVAVHDHAPLRRRDDEPRVGRLRLFGERVDDLARLLAGPDACLNRCEEWCRELTEVKASLIVLVPQEQSGD